MNNALRLYEEKEEICTRFFLLPLAQFYLLQLG